MKISSNIEQYFDDEGRPLVNGRVSFYKHDSDILADIFYVEGADYVQADNPVITADDGRVPTVWFEAAIIDVKIEKCLPDGSYEQIDTFQMGFDYPKAANSTLAYGIEELKNTDPAVGIVQVVGYHTDNDAPARFYVWDANCTTAADGGCIVESDIGEEGRWVLLWDDEKLPSSVYGIVPGSNEANIAAFIGYPDVVGSYNIKMPPIPRFLAGTYTSNTTFSTTKPLYFDKGAKFTYADFLCSRAFIPDYADYVADFGFTGNDVVAHSGWFRSVSSWWTCGAHTMVFDGANHFAYNSLTNPVTISNAVMVGNTRISTSYSNGAYLFIQNCDIQGRKLFSPQSDYIKFSNMNFTTDWFTATNANQYDFGTVASGHRLDVQTILSNTIQFERCTSPMVYYKARLANGDTSFDGHGATYSFTTNDQFTSLSNLKLSSLIDRRCATWKNVYVDSTVTFDVGCASVITMEGCSFMLSGDTSHVTQIALDSCDVRGGGKWLTSTRISVSNSNWGATVELSDAAKSSRALAQLLSFDRCTLSMGANYIWTNNIDMSNCLSNAHVYLVPYSDNGTFRMKGSFIKNRFVSGALIECRPKDMAAEYDVYDVIASLVFTDNRFEQDDSRGIVLPFVTQDFDWQKTFLSPYTATQGGCVYRGNTGKCPGEEPSRLFLSSAMTGSLPWGGDYLHYLPPATYNQRVWNLNSQVNWYPGLMGIQFEPGSASYNKINGRDARAHYGTMLHSVRVVPSDDMNDQFSCVHSWEGIDGWDDSVEVFYM